MERKAIIGNKTKDKTVKKKIKNARKAMTTWKAPAILTKATLIAVARSPTLRWPPSLSILLTPLLLTLVTRMT